MSHHKFFDNKGNNKYITPYSEVPDHHGIVRASILPYIRENSNIIIMLGTKYHGKYTDFGGGCKWKRETWKRCLFREVREELYIGLSEEYLMKYSNVLLIPGKVQDTYLIVLELSDFREIDYNYYNDLDDPWSNKDNMEIKRLFYTDSSYLNFNNIWKLDSSFSYIMKYVLNNNIDLFS